MKTNSAKAQFDRMCKTLSVENVKIGLKPLFKTLLCLLLFLLVSPTAYAQSKDDVRKIPLEDANNDISSDSHPERGLDLLSLLPEVSYNVLNGYMTIESQYVTFGSVTYYIIDDSGLVLLCGDLFLPKECKVELPLSQLSTGMYKIVLEIAGCCFQGEFDVE